MLSSVYRGVNGWLTLGKCAASRRSLTQRLGGGVKQEDLQQFSNLICGGGKRMGKEAEEFFRADLRERLAAPWRPFGLLKAEGSLVTVSHY